jgi:hypothetical protein
MGCDVSEHLNILGSSGEIEDKNLMEFRLLFEGRLPSNGSAFEKHAIRKSFHPQLRELWNTNPNLRSLAMQHPDAGPGPTPDEEKFACGIAAIGRNWNRAGYNLVPLVTPEMMLRCSLDVVLLRPENQLGILKNGDIDNKLKTLFDALRMPESAAETGGENPSRDEDPLFVLLQDDKLISEVKVTTDRLLLLPNERRIRSDDAYAMIHVRLNHRDARTWGNYFG